MSLSAPPCHAAHGERATWWLGCGCAVADAKQDKPTMAKHPRQQTVSTAGALVHSPLGELHLPVDVLLQVGREVVVYHAAGWSKGQHNAVVSAQLHNSQASCSSGVRSPNPTDVLSLQLQPQPCSLGQDADEQTPGRNVGGHQHLRPTAAKRQAAAGLTSGGAECLNPEFLACKHAKSLGAIDETLLRRSLGPAWGMPSS